MWTERQVVADMLKDENYCAIGNLYSSAGISAMIRNVCQSACAENCVVGSGPFPAAAKH